MASSSKLSRRQMLVRALGAALAIPGVASASSAGAAGPGPAAAGRVPESPTGLPLDYGEIPSRKYPKKRRPTEYGPG